MKGPTAYRSPAMLNVRAIVERHARDYGAVPGIVSSLPGTSTAALYVMALSIIREQAEKIAKASAALATEPKGLK